MQKAFYLTVLAFLSAVAQGMTQQLQTDLTSGATRLQPHELYVKKEISGGGKISLLTSQTKNDPGVCSFDEGGKLDVRRAFIFDEFSVCYAQSTSTGAVRTLEYNSKAPKELQNADIVVSQDGKELFRMPIRNVHNISSYDTKANDQFTELKALLALKDGKKVDIDIEFPENVTLPTVNGSSVNIYHYVYVRFNGLQTVVNS